MKRYTYWVGWNAPFDIPDEQMVEVWPRGMKGWCTGEGDDYSTWVARIDAVSAAGAIETLRSCYGHSADRVSLRWEPSELPFGWRHPSERFQDKQGGSR